MSELKLILVVLAIAMCQKVNAQSVDTLFVSTAMQKSIQKYELATSSQSGLYNGSEYAEPRRTNDTHPFFMVDDWQDGDMEYNGQVYRKLPFMYDIFSQRLVSELKNGQPFVLVKDHVKWFTINEKRFINSAFSPFAAEFPAPGYYEELYGGKTKAYAYHFGDRDERVEDYTVEIYFKAKARYYLSVNGKLIRITNKASLLKTLKEHKAEIRSFVRKERLKFSNDWLSGSIATVASYYDTLTPPAE